MMDMSPEKRYQHNPFPLTLCLPGTCYRDEKRNAEMRAEMHIAQCMGFPSICYEYGLLPLVSKETVFTYGRTEYS